MRGWRVAARAVAARTLNFLSRIICDSFSSTLAQRQLHHGSRCAPSPRREYGSMMRQMFSCSSMSYSEFRCARDDRVCSSCSACLPSAASKSCSERFWCAVPTARMASSACALVAHAGLAVDDGGHVVGRVHHDLAQQHVLEAVHAARVADRVEVLERLVKVGEGRLEVLLLGVQAAGVARRSGPAAAAGSRWRWRPSAPT